MLPKMQMMMKKMIAWYDSQMFMIKWFVDIIVNALIQAKLGFYMPQLDK